MTGPRRAWLAVVWATSLFWVPGTALAQETAMSVDAPPLVAVGDRVEVQATVTVDGEPLAGVELSLTYPTSFAGERGRVELDRETTAADGVAVLTYEQRASENGLMRVEYVGSDDLVLAPVEFEIAVEPDPQQQHRSEAGISIPWLNGWVVIAVIMLVWVLIVYSAFQLVKVGRGGAPAVSGLDVDSGSTWVSVAFVIVTVVTAAGMAIVFLRNPLTHANLDGPEGYDRTPVAEVGVKFNYLGPGLGDPSLAESGDDLLNGELRYFQFGCGGCHGLYGNGGVVAPALLGEVGSLGGFTEDVREGPKTMPVYPPEALSDEHITLIHLYLKESDGG